MRILIKRWQLLLVCRAISAWRVFVAAICEGEAREVRQKARREATVARCARRMRHLTQSQTFGRWFEAAREQRKMRHRVQTVVQRWRQREIARALAAWLSMVDTRKMCRRVMNKLTGRTQRGSLAVAMHTWRSVLVASIDRDDEEARRTAVIARVVQRMRHSTSLRVFNQWADMAAGQKRRRHCVRKVVQRWRQLALSRVLAGWLTFVEDRACRRRALRLILRECARGKRTTARRGFRAWQTHTQGSRNSERLRTSDRARLDVAVRRFGARSAYVQRAVTFRRWRVWVANAMVRRTIILRSVRRMKHRTAAASMAAWRDYCEHRVRVKKLCGRIVRRAMSGRLAEAWMTWMCVLRDALEGEEGEEEEEQRHQAVVRHLVGKMHNRHIDRAFVAWVEMVQRKTRNRNLAVKALAHLTQRKVVAAMTAWIDMNESRQLCRKVMNKILKRFLRAGQAAAWVAWRDSTKGDKEANVKEARRAQTCRRMVRRATTGLVGAAWMTWVRATGQAGQDATMTNALKVQKGLCSLHETMRVRELRRKFRAFRWWWWKRALEKLLHAQLAAGAG